MGGRVAGIPARRIRGPIGFAAAGALSWKPRLLFSPSPLGLFPSPSEAPFEALCEFSRQESRRTRLYADRGPGGDGDFFHGYPHPDFRHGAGARGARNPTLRGGGTA